MTQGDNPVAADGSPLHRTAAAGLVLLYLLLSVVSWHRSGDLLVDWGRELYTAWRLAEGDVLYRDVASLFGPLSSHVNALLFRAFGISASVVQAANVLGIGLLSLLLYDVFRRISGRLGGALATYLFLSMFAFAHMTEAGIFNFVTPYSHDATLGFALCATLVWTIMLVERRATVVTGFAAGLACGLAWLTKPEIGFAAVATLATGVLLLARRPNRPGAGVWLAVLCGAALPSCLAILAFARPLGISQALAVPLEAYSSATAARAWDMAFYQAVSGMARPWRNLSTVIGSALLLVVFFGALEILERHLQDPRLRKKVGVALLSLSAVILIVWMDSIPWLETARPLPVLTLAICTLAVGQAWRSPEGAVQSRVGFACWSVLSLALLSKVALLARFYHFGFYLVLPATLLLAVVLVVRLPNWLPATSGQYVRGFAVLLVGIISAKGLGIELRQYLARSFEVESGGDRIAVFPPYVDPRAFTVSETMGYLQGLKANVSTVLVLPEGAMLNYWLRKPTPTPHLSFMPPEVARYGESAISQALQLSPPEVVVLTERRLVEYGLSEFSTTPFGESIGLWLRTDYCLLNQVWARATDFEATKEVRPSAVAHPTHGVAVYGRKGSMLCAGGLS